MGRLARSLRVTMWLATAGAVGARWALDRVVVEGSSMLPTFRPGDRLLLVRRVRALRAGDLVAFDDPRADGRLLVKRVVAVHDEGVEVAGDNPAASTDSRSFGLVPASSIRHLVVRRYLEGAP